MRVKWLLCLVTLSAFISFSHGLLVDLMKKAKKNMMMNSNCDCPCREYWTTKCSVEYRTECKQMYTHRECKKIPEQKPMRVKETECQKCIRYYETVMETKSIRQCVDVFDEKCETQYPAKCTEDQSCTMVYQTKCDTVGYSQKCQQVPVRKCQPITKCHRIPKTTCRPFKKEKCGNKPTQIPTRKMMHKCLPFTARPKENLAECGQMADQPSSSYGAPSSSADNYGAPNAGPSSPMPVQDMLPPPMTPIPILNGNEEDTYGTPLGQPVTLQETLMTNINIIPNEDSYGSPIANKYVSPSDPTPVNSVSAPQKYSAPTDTFSLVNNQKTQPYQDTTLATIRVVNPPNNIAGNGPFIPSNDINKTPKAESTRTGKTLQHPNQLLRDFRPSVRLPDNFVHQIGNMIINPANGAIEVLNTSPSMKKMIFPHSSEEMQDDFEPIKETNNELMDSVEEYDEDYYASEEQETEEEYDFYDEESAIQTLLLTNVNSEQHHESNENDDNVTKDKSREEILQDILEDEEKDANPFLKKLKKKRRRIRPYGVLQSSTRTLYGRRIKG